MTTTTAQYEQPGSEFSYALFVEDEFASYSLILGNMDDVKLAAEALQRLLDRGQADEFISHLDDRLGYAWLSVSEAATKYDVPVDTVRYAARNGHIRMAQKNGRGWKFPEWKFRHWLEETYNPRERKEK